MRTLFPRTNKILGFAIIVISVISFLSLYTVTMRIADQAHNTCVHEAGNTCTVLGHVPYESFLGLGGLSALGLLGVLMVLRGETEKKVASLSLKKFGESLKSLLPEEKTIFDQVKNSDGFIFQNDLIQKTGFSKVKVSRLLDKLETKGLLERRRRGMSNVVILKG